MSAAASTASEGAGPAVVRSSRWAVLALVVAGAIAYHNSLTGVFVYDDQHWIVENPDIRVLWPLTVPMGQSFRPLVFITLALDHAVSGLEPWSYHLTNLGFHLASALVAFGLLRRVLCLPRVGLATARADGIAFATCVVWVVHPMTTQAVTYVIQRAELMSTLAYLAVLYAFVRARTAPDAAYRRRWSAASVAAFYLGLACKEILVTAPLTVLLLDAVLFRAGFLEALRRGKGLYAALLAPYVLAPAYWLVAAPWRFHLAKPGLGTPTPWQYAWTQGRAIVEYLRMLVWPAGQNLDHAWRLADIERSALPSGLLVLTLLAGAVEGTRRRAPVALLGICFFVVLAPTSSVFPIADAFVEHRVYLAALPVLALVAVGGDVLLRALVATPGPRLAVTGALLLTAVTALTAATISRNAVYRSRVSMWSDVVAKAPHNARGHFNLGQALLAEDRRANERRALDAFETALRLRPSYGEAHNNVGSIHMDAGDAVLALAHFDAALAAGWDELEVRVNRANALLLLERYADAAEAYELALDEIRRQPRHAAQEPRLRNNLGVCHERLAAEPEAIAQFQGAVARDPEFVDAWVNLVRTLARAGRHDEAVTAARRTCAVQPGAAEHHLRLARALVGAGRAGEAVDAYLIAMELDRSLVDARVELAQLCARPETRNAVERALAEASAADRANVEALRYLEMVRQLAGRER